MKTKFRIALSGISYIAFAITIAITFGCAGIQHKAPHPSMKPYSELFEWVKENLPPLKGNYDVPEIYLVDRDTLRDQMADAIDSDPADLYGLLAEQYGQEYADEMREFILKEAVTLCHPRTLKIYILDTLNPCHTEAQAVYGMTYYLAISEHGTGEGMPFGQLMMRRMYYGRISQLMKTAYYVTFCVKDMPAEDAPADSEKKIEI